MSQELQERAKQQASFQAVDEVLLAGGILSKDSTGLVLGIGSGSTVVYAVQRIGQLASEGKIKVKACIPSSFQATLLIQENNLPLSTLNVNPRIDVCFDGADEVSERGECIKGGGACQLQEKMLIANAKKWIVVADFRKDSKHLGTQWKKGVPIEVHPLAYSPVLLTLSSSPLNGHATLRMAPPQKAGPVVTDNGNFVVDVVFGKEWMERPMELDLEIQKIVGVMETGLFCGMADAAYFGMEDGSVKVVKYNKK